MTPADQPAAARPADAPSHLLYGVLDTAITLGDAAFGCIQVIDPDGHLRIVAHRGLPDWWREYWDTAPPGEGACGASLAADERVIVEDVEQSPIFAGTPSLTVQLKAGVRAVHSTPLRGQSGQVLGIFSTHYGTPRRFDARTLTVLDLLAAHAASLIEHARREQALRDLEGQYRTVVETSVDGFWVADGAGRILAVNDRYARRSGYSREELLTLHIADLEGRESPEDIEAHQAKVRSQGSDLFETVHRTRSGERWLVEVNVTYRPEGGGRYFAFLRDISARKRLEAELRESEERFRLAMDAAAEGIWDWNLDTGAVYYSPGYAAMLGYRPDEIEPRLRGFVGLLHPDDSGAIVETARRHLEDSGHYSMEFRLRRADGTYCWILSRGKVVERDTGGTPRRAIGTHMDITERKQAQHALEQTRNLLAEAQKIAHLGTFEFIVADGTTVWSEEQFRLHGLDPTGPSPSLDEILARHVLPEDVDWLRSGFLAAIGQQGEYDQEHRIVRPDGSVRWIHTRARPQLDEHGRCRRYVGTSLDITERKREEAEAHTHNELIQSLARHQVAVQTAAAFAHELNQPLVAVSAYNEVALRALRGTGPDTDQLARVIEGSHQQAQRAGRVLRDLIDHLQKGAPEPRPFDINELVRNVIAKVRKTDARRIAVILDLDPGLPPVLGGRLQTEKVLLNLIQNGLDAMERSGVAPASLGVTVRTMAESRMAHVTVRDNGPGIDADTARRIFDPFFSTKPNGLGLGLAVSRSLIEAQHGQLWLDPEDGPGAVFHFTLPFAHA